MTRVAMTRTLLARRVGVAGGGPGVAVATRLAVGRSLVGLARAALGAALAAARRAAGLLLGVAGADVAAGAGLAGVGVAFLAVHAGLLPGPGARHAGPVAAHAHDRAPGRGRGDHPDDVGAPGETAQVDRRGQARATQRAHPPAVDGDPRAQQAPMARLAQPDGERAPARARP